MSEVDSINGWKPPIINEDFGLGPGRIATQDDVDQMRQKLDALGQFTSAVKLAMVNLEANMQPRDRAHGE